MNLTLLLGSIALFIHSLEKISNTLIENSLSKIKDKLTIITSSNKKSLLTGFISTLIIQSSSAFIMIVISFINGNLLTFNQSIGLILGSNIATTLSSFFIGINLEKISPFLLLIFLFFSKSKNEKVSKFSTILFYISLLFFSIFSMSLSLSSLKENKLFTHYIELSTNNFFLSLLIGTLLTIALQSSSLFISILQIFSMSSLISPILTIPLIFGANIGTSFDGLITLINGNKESKKLAHFSILFNILTVLIFTVLISPFTFIIKAISLTFNLNNALTIATINIVFNLLGVLITLPFLNKIKRYYSKW